MQTYPTILSIEIGWTAGSECAASGGDQADNLPVALTVKHHIIFAPPHVSPDLKSTLPHRKLALRNTSPIKRSNRVYLRMLKSSLIPRDSKI